MYLEQISMFQNLPQPVSEILLDNVRTKYFATNTVIHQDEEEL